MYCGGVQKWVTSELDCGHAHVSSWIWRVSRGRKGQNNTSTAHVCPGQTDLHIWCVVVTNLSVCLFVCQQVACDVVTVYSRSESPCHVSLSQSNRYRPVDRSIGYESPGQSLDQSISMSVGAYVQRVTPARSHHRRKYILRPSVDLFYLSLFLSLFIFIPLSTHSSRVSQYPRLTESRQLVVSCFRDRAPRGSTRRDPRERERDMYTYISSPRSSSSSRSRPTHAKRRT